MPSACSACRLAKAGPAPFAGRGRSFLGRQFDARPDLAAKYNVHTVPTLLLVEDNRVVEEFVGLTYRHQVRQAIEQAAKR